MKPELKKKWVEALRSGKYTQIRETLSDGKGFCCLGVLCDVSDKGFWNELDQGSYTLEDGEHIEGDLGRIGRAYFGIDEEIETKLVRMNDGTKGVRRHSFEEIAEFIEANIAV